MILKVLIVGVTLSIILGVAWPWLARKGLGRLPGDLTLNFRGSRVYIPLTTCILIAVAVMFVSRLFGR